ncbi:dnaJ homolog subfamily C member 16-like isoform X2 [Artemia franciscana]|uniref:DnaJ homolog subfamily C member 16 n=1 Tax=Artemia franciscana TaxID=6661 RepID=A0AA88H6F0_ARTSF|nr:hypothetical protein QYM36_015874 [Artemia franciscana]
MKMKFLLILLLSFCFESVSSHFDPYGTLGVKRGATLQEIRKAYKLLAKEWHPDKSNNPSAQEEFVEINRAYELLRDPERRKLYDNRGISEDTPNFRPPRPEAYAYSTFDPFDDLSSVFGKGFRFQFHMPDSGLFHEQTITLKGYEKNVLPASARTPQLILTYSDWCMGCVRAAPMWKRLGEEMNPVGISMSTVHAGREPKLARNFGARTDSLPHLVLLMDGRIYQYRDETLSVINIIRFIREKFGTQLIPRVDDSNYEDFLNGWRDNRVRVLITGKAEVLRLRYLALAYQYRRFAAFGYARLIEGETTQIQDRYNIPSTMDSMFVFREEVDTPAAKLSMPDLPFSVMTDVLEANKYLLLPRISSQKILDELCPLDSSRVRRRLCVMLVAEEEDEDAQESLRKYAKVYRGPGKDRVGFVYVSKKGQQAFVQALIEADESMVKNPDRRLVIIWRRNLSSVSFLWIPGTWKRDEESENDGFAEDILPPWNSSQYELTAALKRLFSDDGNLPNETTMKELVDENAAGLLQRIYNRILILLESIKDRIRKEDLLAAVSVIATIVFIMAVAYVMAYLVSLEEETIQAKRSKATSPSSNSCASTASTATLQLKMHELRGETYNGMVRLLKPGCRTIVLLLDKETKAKILPVFHRIVWPYRKNKTLMFGWMYVERGLDWYKQLLSLALPLGEGNPDPQQLESINPRNCIGTILSLNGHRKYFCIYHAKHLEGQQRAAYAEAKNNGLRRRIGRSRGQKKNGEDFLGFEDSSSDSDRSSDVEQGLSSPDDVINRLIISTLPTIYWFFTHRQWGLTSAL